MVFPKLACCCLSIYKNNVPYGNDKCMNQNRVNIKHFTKE